MAMEEKAKEKEFLGPRFGSDLAPPQRQKNPKFLGDFFFLKAGNLDMFFVVLVCNDYLDANPKSFTN